MGHEWCMAWNGVDDMGRDTAERAEKAAEMAVRVR
jgi:hypothetical protein